MGAFLTEARRAELRAQNIYTIEALAAIDGLELKNLGMDGRDLKNKAMEYLEESTSRRAEHPDAVRAGGAARQATRCSRKTFAPSRTAGRSSPRRARTASTA